MVKDWTTTATVKEKTKNVSAGLQKAKVAEDPFPLLFPPYPCDPFAPMLRYRRGGWLSAFYWWGGVHQLVLGSSLAYACIVTGIYLAQRTTGISVKISSTSLHSLGGFVVFLLVFRLNQSLLRHNDGKQSIHDLFSALEDIISCNNCSLQGSDCFEESVTPSQAQKYAELALVAKINVIRLTLAFGVGFILHCRLVEATAESGGIISLEAISPNLCPSATWLACQVWICNVFGLSL